MYLKHHTSYNRLGKPKACVCISLSLDVFNLGIISCRFWRVSLTTEDVMSTALAFACGKFIVATCPIQTLALPTCHLQLFVRSVHFHNHNIALIDSICLYYNL